MYFLTQGEVVVQQVDPVCPWKVKVLRRVCSGTESSFFGELGCLTGNPRSATVTAKTPCELYTMTGDELLDLQDEYEYECALMLDIGTQRAQQTRRGSRVSSTTGLSPKAHGSKEMDLTDLDSGSEGARSRTNSTGRK